MLCKCIPRVTGNIDRSCARSPTGSPTRDAEFLTLLTLTGTALHLVDQISQLIAHADAGGPVGGASNPEHACIEREISQDCQAQLAIGRMGRIDQRVGGFRDDCRGHQQDQLPAGIEPFPTECLSVRRNRKIGPGGRQGGYLCSEGQRGIIGQIDCDQHQWRMRSRPKVDELFECADLDGGAGIQRRMANRIPAPTMEAGALAGGIKCPFSGGDAPKPQAAPPVAIALSTCRTETAPGSVSMSSSGAALPSARFG
jgi:hypothetical protein